MKSSALTAKTKFVLTRELPTLRPIVLPRSDHGPQHEFPELVANCIATFVRATR